MTSVYLVHLQVTNPFGNSELFYKLIVQLACHLLLHLRSRLNARNTHRHYALSHKWRLVNNQCRREILILVSVGICVDGSKSNQSFPHEVNNPMDKTIDKKLCNVLILLFFSG